MHPYISGPLEVQANILFLHSKYNIQKILIPTVSFYWGTQHLFSINDLLFRLHYFQEKTRKESLCCLGHNPILDTNRWGWSLSSQREVHYFFFSLLTLPKTGCTTRVKGIFSSLAARFLVCSRATLEWSKLLVIKSALVSVDNA